MTSNSPNADGARPVLRTRDLAAIAGTTPRTLRHYHQIGLLPEVGRDANGYRRYGVGDLVRLLRIRQLAASGLPLRKIAHAIERGPEKCRRMARRVRSARLGDAYRRRRSRTTCRADRGLRGCRHRSDRHHTGGRRAAAHGLGRASAIGDAQRRATASVEPLHRDGARSIACAAVTISASRRR